MGAAWFGMGSKSPDEEDTGRIKRDVLHDAVGDHAAQAETKIVEPVDPGVVESVEAGDAADADLRAQRATLIELCLYALDRARSGGVVERLEEGLAGIGVKALRPDGQRFDPAVHEAGGTVSTSDSTQDGVVAETEVVGFMDGEKLLRAPIVTVYAVKQGGQ